MVPHLRTIFVYGGRGIDKDTIKDSGWYTYSIQENKWESVLSVFLHLCTRVPTYSSAAMPSHPVRHWGFDFVSTVSPSQVPSEMTIISPHDGLRS
jgi:hypothetical protein